MKQRNLFDMGSPDMPPAQLHSATSVAAAEAIRPELGQLQQLALRLFRDAGEAGLTDEELTARMERSASTARPRRIELVAARLVRDSGRVRPGKSGRGMTVWVAQ
jgi:hypothetical protein